MKKALNDGGISTDAARHEFIPHTYKQLDESTLKVVGDMVDELESLDEVVRVYDNAESDSETSAAV